MFDIAFPRNNEAAFLEMAEELNTKEIYFIYSSKDFLERNKKKIIQSKVKVSFGIIADVKDILKAKRLCSFVITPSSENDQHTLEKLKPSLIFDLEKSEKMDKTHFRLSGLNQVLCKLSFKNNITVGLSFSSLLHTSKVKRKVILGRMIQNLRFTKKYKVNISFYSFAKTPFELRSFKDLSALQRVLRNRKL